MENFWTSWQPKILSVFRFMMGFLFLWHGSQKILGFPASDRPSDGPMPPIIMVAGLLELVGGFLLMIGLGTRWVAFILSGLMAVAYWMAHGMNAFLPIVNKGEMAVLYCFIFFYLFFAGGGSWSVDNLLKKKE